jgi:hypothetical protein
MDVVRNHFYTGNRATKRNRGRGKRIFPLRKENISNLVSVDRGQRTLKTSLTLGYGHFLSDDKWEIISKI